MRRFLSASSKSGPKSCETIQDILCQDDTILEITVRAPKK